MGDSSNRHTGVAAGGITEKRSAAGDSAPLVPDPWGTPATPAPSGGDPAGPVHAAWASVPEDAYSEAVSGGWGAPGDAITGPLPRLRRDGAALTPAEAANEAGNETPDEAGNEATGASPDVTASE